MFVNVQGVSRPAGIYHPPVRRGEDPAAGNTPGVNTSTVNTQAMNAPAVNAPAGNAVNAPGGNAVNAPAGNTVNAPAGNAVNAPAVQQNAAAGASKGRHGYTLYSLADVDVDSEKNNRAGLSQVRVSLSLNICIYTRIYIHLCIDRYYMHR